jgi:hypothetical protein
MITRWISDVPSKIVKLLEVRAVSAGRWPDNYPHVSTNSAPRCGPPGVQTPSGWLPACSALAASAASILRLSAAGVLPPGGHLALGGLGFGQAGARAEGPPVPDRGLEAVEEPVGERAGLE